MFVKFSDFFEKLKIVNKSFKGLLDDKFYKEFGVNIYGEKFWSIAAMRDSSISKPRKTSFYELRIPSSVTSPFKPQIKK